LPLAVSRTPSANFPCCVSRSWGFFFIWIFIGAFWFRFIVWEGGSSFGSCKDSQQIRNVLCYDALDSLSLVCLSALDYSVSVSLSGDCHRSVLTPLHNFSFVDLASIFPPTCLHRRGAYIWISWNQLYLGIL
jgi:hypothetical protein